MGKKVKDKSEEKGKAPASRYSLKARAAIESTHVRHNPPVYGCARCYPPERS
jgi:hypothetical protein